MVIAIRMTATCADCGKTEGFTMTSGQAGVRRAREAFAAGGWEVKRTTHGFVSNHPEAADRCPSCADSTTPD